MRAGGIRPDANRVSGSVPSIDSAPGSGRFGMVAFGVRLRGILKCVETTKVLVSRIHNVEGCCCRWEAKYVSGGDDGAIEVGGNWVWVLIFRRSDLQ